MTDATWEVLLVFVFVAVVIEGVVLVGVLRQLGTILVQIGPPRPGIVDGAGPPTGSLVDLEVVSRDIPSVLVFLSPSCQLCPPVAAALPDLEREFPEVEVIRAVVGAATDDKLAYARQVGPRARTDLDGLYEKWQVPGTPFAVGITSDGRVAVSGVVNSFPQLETLVQTVLNADPPPEIRALVEQKNSERIVP
jgi:hypothetical protein